MSADPRYEMHLYWSQEDGAYIAEVADLPGCVADGATYEEAVANARTVIAQWIESARSIGRGIPPPKSRPGSA
jgi:predicted RNase H-like HicB family nuclease